MKIYVMAVNGGNIIYFATFNASNRHVIILLHNRDHNYLNKMGEFMC